MSDLRDFIAENLASLPAEIDRLVAGKDPLPCYDLSLIGKLAACDEDTLFTLRHKMRAIPDFSLREFDRRIKVERMAMFEPKANGQTNWKDLLLQTEAGAPRAILANAITALRAAPEWKGVLAYNQFSSRSVIQRPTPWSTCGSWTDSDDILFANWLQHNGISVGSNIAAEASSVVSKDRSFHPVKDWLNSLIWDGDARIGRFLSDYYGSDSNLYTNSIGKMWLISAVARVMQPGCQADHCLILESDQGIRKSTSLRILASDDWFTDQISNLDMPQASQDLQGKWIVEFADLVRMGTSEANTLKSFITRRIDHFRPPYGRRVVDFPRQTIFSASTNDKTYLIDPTGGRRFWSVECRSIELDALRDDREQIWAEAVYLYKSGMQWWIEDPELLKQAKIEQATRQNSDSWDKPIWKWVSDQKQQNANKGRRSDEFFIVAEEVLEICMEKKPGSWGPGDKARVGKVLKARGMERYRDWVKDDFGKPVLGADDLPESRYIYRFTPPPKS